MSWRCRSVVLAAVVWVGAPSGARACVPDELREYEAVIRAAAELYGLPEALLWAVFKTESQGRADAVSSAGAVGVAQLMPRTARSQGVWDRENPFQSILGGARYLRLQVNRYDGDVALALAAYNAGPGNVDRYGGIPPFEETQRYVPKVLRRYWSFLACQRGEV
jgi:soluble lytic murein transglycosylase-like protein